MEKPNMIVLWGRGNSGKTHTLNIVLLKLYKIYGACISYGSLPSKIGEDSCVILEYRGKRIGVITKGDNDQLLKNSYDTLPFDCDIYIWASRTKGNTCKYIEKHEKCKGIIWHEKWAVTERITKTGVVDYLQNKVNDIQADGIIDTIDILI